MREGPESGAGSPCCFSYSVFAATVEISPLCAVSDRSIELAENASSGRPATLLELWANEGV